jgi:hypothetical protein
MARASDAQRQTKRFSVENQSAPLLGLDSSLALSMTTLSRAAVGMEANEALPSRSSKRLLLALDASLTLSMTAAWSAAFYEGEGRS